MLIRARVAAAVVQVLRHTWKALVMDVKGLVLANARNVRSAVGPMNLLANLGRMGKEAPVAGGESAANAGAAGGAGAAAASSANAEPLNQRQLTVIRVTVELLRDFFRGEGDGLQAADLTDMPWIQQLTALYELPTKALIAKMFEDGPTGSVRLRGRRWRRGEGRGVWPTQRKGTTDTRARWEVGTLQEEHGNLVLSLLSARTSDPLAQEFLREHEDAARRRQKWQR